MFSNELTKEYGSGFTARNLRNYRQIYMYYTDIEIWHTRVPNLSWSHFRRILAVANPKAREWYVKEESEQMWSIRTLDRNISMQYYERILAPCNGVTFHCLYHLDARRVLHETCQSRSSRERECREGEENRRIKAAPSSAAPSEKGKTDKMVLPFLYIENP